MPLSVAVGMVFGKLEVRETAGDPGPKQQLRLRCLSCEGMALMRLNQLQLKLQNGKPLVCRKCITKMTKAQRGRWAWPGKKQWDQ